MSDETKLNTPQLVDAWVRMCCAEEAVVTDIAESARLADRGIEELRKRLPVEGADGGPFIVNMLDNPQPTQRTAEEWRAACEEVAGEIWWEDGIVYPYDCGATGLSAMAGKLDRPALVEARGCDTESDALEQLHAALSKRLEQKRRREGGEHG